MRYVLSLRSFSLQGLFARFSVKKQTVHTEIAVFVSISYAKPYTSGVCM